MNKIILQCTGVSKQFADGQRWFAVLRSIDLTIEQQAMVAIMGRSGSGKTTLLQLLGGLDLPTTGKIEVCGVDLNKIDQTAKASFRNMKLGFIYQQPRLLPEFTAVENVSLPLLIRNIPIAKAKHIAGEFLEAVGLKDRLHFMPNKLSGGEKQRVAIARALINQPECILADEPTGNLDSENSQMIMELIKQIQQIQRTAVIMVTHDLNLAKEFQQIYYLQAGEIHRKLS